MAPDQLKRLPILQPLRPFDHTRRFRQRTASAYLTLARNAAIRTPRGATAFIAGCGRSGTTVLGQALALHPGVTYLFEPSARWAVIERSTDMWQLFRPGPHSAFIGADCVVARTHRRYRALMRGRTGTLLVEKSPANNTRIGFLDALDGQARYVHIVRDGTAVAWSINRLAGLEIPMTAGRSHNQWWGVDGSKWQALLSDGTAAGYFPHEAKLLRTDEAKAIYEWIISIEEVRRWSNRLGSRLIEIRYDDLVTDPRVTLRAVAEHLKLPISESWLDAASGLMRPARPLEHRSLVLPPDMTARFNRLQAEFGFAGRAVATA